LDGPRPGPEPLGGAVPPRSSRRFFAVIARRAAGEPLPYLIQKQEFYGLAFVGLARRPDPPPRNPSSSSSRRSLWRARGHSGDVVVRRRGYGVRLHCGGPGAAAGVVERLGHRHQPHALDVARRMRRSMTSGSGWSSCAPTCWSVSGPGPSVRYGARQPALSPSRDSGIIEPSVRDYEPHEDTFRRANRNGCYAQLVPHSEVACCAAGAPSPGDGPGAGGSVEAAPLKGAGFAIEAILNDLRGWPVV